MRLDVADESNWTATIEDILTRHERIDVACQQCRCVVLQADRRNDSR